MLGIEIITIVNIVLVLFASVAIGTLYYLLGKELMVQAAGIALVLSTVLFTSIVMIEDETKSGTPKEFNDLSQNIPLVIRSIDWEDSESLVYLTVVPYNNVNGTRTLCEISWDDISTPTNLSVGMRIVNNNGVIQQV